MYQTILLFSIISIFACNNTKEISGSDFKSIRFGTGGGFTGEVITYELGSDGQLNLLGQDKTKFHKNLDKNVVKQIFDDANAVKNYKFNTPGNLYSFLELVWQDSTNKITWSVGSSEVSIDVTKLHGKLISLTK